MTTVRDLIKDSLMLFGAIGVGESIDGDEATDLFRSLNRMWGNWSTQIDLIFVDTVVQHTLTNASEYTIGVGATIDTPRPIQIKTAYYREGDIDYPLEIIDEYKYASITQKSLDNGSPEYLYFKEGYPTGSIVLYPKPSGTKTLFMDVHQPLEAFTSLNQTITLPTGYEQALVYNFAKQECGKYGKSLTREQDIIARDSLMDIKRTNQKNDRFEASINAPFKKGAYDIRGDRRL